MKRMVVALAAVVLLVTGTAVAAMAAPWLDDQAPQQGWTCPGWTGTFGNYDPATNPTLKRLAEKLNIGADALASELKAGKSVADVAAAQKVDLQVLVDTLTAPQKELMATRVKYGYMTQDQANQALEYMAQGIKNQLQIKGYFGGFGGMRGSGYGPGMMGGSYGPGGATGGNVGPRGMMGGNFGGGMMGGGFRGGPWQQNRSN